MGCHSLNADYSLRYQTPASKPSTAESPAACSSVRVEKQPPKSDKVQQHSYQTRWPTLFFHQIFSDNLERTPTVDSEVFQSLLGGFETANLWVLQLTSV